MFKEEVSYDSKLPIYIRIIELEEYPLHYHTDIEFIFVLKGEIKLISGSNRYILKQNAVFVCNGKEVHGMYATGKENIVALVQINNQIFSKYYPNLSRSCYRTYTKSDEDIRVDFLRTELLRILFNHITKAHHYQENNVATTKKLLSYLEANFNYFSIENNIVINKPFENFTMSKRVSRIILTVYENYYKHITLEEISAKENLSEYYLSHIIHDHIGISFREFLSFARVESSHSIVLNSSIDINEIHTIVGFSGRQYFEKHFKKWFKQTPSEYRENFASKIKSEKKQEQYTNLEKSRIISLLNDYEHSGNKIIQSGNQNLLNVTADGMNGKSIKFNPQVSVYAKSKNIKNPGILSKLKNLKPDQILNCEHLHIRRFYGLDTIAGAVYILRNIRLNKVALPFMDPIEESEILQGANGIVFNNGIAKCSYYSLLFLGKAKGDLIDSGTNYWIIKKTAENSMPSFVIMVFNGSNETDAVCENDYPREKTLEAIASFNEELNIKFSLKGLFGPFKIATVTLDSTTDYFSYMNNYGNCSASTDIEELLAEQYTLPYVNIYNTDAQDSLEINTRLDGLCVQFIAITPLQL